MGFGWARLSGFVEVDGLACYLTSVNDSRNVHTIKLLIDVEYDPEAPVWVAVNDRLGLATEATTMEVLTYKLQEMIPELVEMNHLDVSHPVPFVLVSHCPEVGRTLTESPSLGFRHLFE